MDAQEAGKQILEDFHGQQIVEKTLMLTKVCARKCLGGFLGEINDSSVKCISFLLWVKSDECGNNFLEVYPQLFEKMKEANLFVFEEE